MLSNEIVKERRGLKGLNVYEEAQVATSLSHSSCHVYADKKSVVRRHFGALFTSYHLVPQRLPQMIT